MMKEIYKAKNVLKNIIKISLIGILLIGMVLGPRLWGMRFFYFIWIVAIWGFADEYLEYWNDLKKAIQKSDNIDEILRDKIDSKLAGKHATIEWLFLSFCVTMVILALLIPFEDLLTQLFGIDLLYYVFFIIFTFIFSQKYLKSFIRTKIKTSRPEIQLFFYFFFNHYIFLMYFILVFVSGFLISPGLELDKVIEIKLYFLYIGYTAINALVVMIILRFVFFVVDDILEEIIEKQISDLRKERDILNEEIREIAKDSFNKMDSENIQYNYWKKCIYESGMEAIQDEIERIKWKYRQEPPVIAIVATSIALTSPLTKLAIDIFGLLL